MASKFELQAVLTAKNIAKKAIASYTKGIDGAGKSTSAVSTAMSGAKTASLALAAAIAAAAAAAVKFGFEGVRLAGNIEQSTMSFKALLGSAEAAAKTIERIKKEARTTPFEIQGLTDGALALTAITKDGDKAIDTLLDVGKAIAISGKGQADLDLVIANLQQIAATGVVTELDIRQFQRAVPIFNDILASAGLTTTQLKDSTNASELLFDAFEKAASEGGIAFEGFSAQAGTFNQLVSNLKDSWVIFLSEIVESSGVFDSVKQVLAEIIESIEYLTSLITGETSFSIEELLDRFGAFGVFIQEQVIPIIQQISDKFRQFVDDIRPYIGAFLLWLQGIWQKNGDTIMQIVTVVWQTVGFIISTALDLIFGTIKVILALISGEWELAFMAIESVVTNVFGNVKTFIDKTLSSVVGIVERYINSIIDKVNSAIDLINVFKNTRIPNVNFSGGNKNMQHGGIVTRPTRAFLGEAGPEAVIPLNKAGGRLAGASVGGGSITINVNGLVPFTPGQRLEVGRLLLEEIYRAANSQNMSIEGLISKTA